MGRHLSVHRREYRVFVQSLSEEQTVERIAVLHAQLADARRGRCFQG